MHPADHARLDRPSVDPTADVLGSPADRLFIYIMGSHNVLFSPISLVKKSSLVLLIQYRIYISMVERSTADCTHA